MNSATPPIQSDLIVDQESLTALDHQPYGCIKLDRTGRVLEFNVAASVVLGVRASDAIGKCFFTEIAPCTNNPDFFGHFDSAMQGNCVLNKVLDHHFLLTNALLLVPGFDLRLHMFSSTDTTGKPVVWIVTRKTADKILSSLINIQNGAVLSETAKISAL